MFVYVYYYYYTGESTELSVHHQSSNIDIDLRVPIH